MPCAQRRPCWSVPIAVENPYKDVGYVTLDVGSEAVVFIFVWSEGIGDEFGDAVEGDGGEGGVVAAIVVVDGESDVHAIYAIDGEDDTCLGEGGGGAVGEEPEAAVVAVAEVGEVDGEFVDCGNFGGVSDDGFHGDEGEVESDGAVAAPLVLEDDGVGGASAGVVFAIGAAVEPGVGFAVEYIVGGMADVGDDEVEVASAVAFGFGVVVFAGVAWL